MCELLGSLDPTAPIIVYVHGNQIPSGDVRTRGLAVYRRLVQCAGDDRPMQFVIFSWCSDKVRGLLRDFRQKAARTEPVAWQLAWTINQAPGGASIGLLGYSYGARVSTGATHLLAGGRLGSLEIADASPSRRIRTVYLAPALDACWLREGRHHGESLRRVESCLLTKNPSDPAMRFFRFSSKQYNPQALGFRGPIGLSSEYASHVRVCPVSDSVGRSHDLYRYIAARGVMSAAWRRLAYSDGPTTGAPRLAGR